MSAVDGLRRWWPFLVAACLLYAADQATKALAVAHLTPNVPQDFVGSLLRLHLIRNSGAAFSTGTSVTWLFSVLSIVALAVVLWVALRARSPLWLVGLGLLAGGVAGNLTDRIFREPGAFRGHVVDFLELPHWPIFNLADNAINAAAVIVVIQVLRNVKLDGTRARKGEELDDDSPADD